MTAIWWNILAALSGISALFSPVCKSFMSLAPGLFSLLRHLKMNAPCSRNTKPSIFRQRNAAVVCHPFFCKRGTHWRCHLYHTEKLSMWRLSGALKWMKSLQNVPFPSLKAASFVIATSSAAFSSYRSTASFQWIFKRFNYAICNEFDNFEFQPVLRCLECSMIEITNCLSNTEKIALILVYA